MVRISLLLGFWALPAMAWTHVNSNLYGWQSPNVAFSVNTANCTIADDELYSIIDEAISTWNSAPTTGLVVTRNPTESTLTFDDFGTATRLIPHIVCSTDFSADLGVDGNGVPAATLTTPTTTGYLSQGMVVLNAEAGTSSEISQMERGELVLVLAHEIGHALGLGHSSTLEALMYYSIAGKDSAILVQDDVDGLVHLYPRNEFTGGPFGCSAVHGARGPSSLLWAVAFLCGLLALGRRVVAFRPAPPLSLRE